MTLVWIYFFLAEIVGTRLLWVSAFVDSFLSLESLKMHEFERVFVEFPLQTYKLLQIDMMMWWMWYIWYLHPKRHLVITPTFHLQTCASRYPENLRQAPKSAPFLFGLAIKIRIAEVLFQISEKMDCMEPQCVAVAFEMFKLHRFCCPMKLIQYAYWHELSLVEWYVTRW